MYLRKSIDGILHQYENANWRRSTNHSHCSAGLFELPRLVLRLPSPDYTILAGSEICKTDGDHKNIKIVSVPVRCNAYVELN